MISISVCVNVVSCKTVLKVHMKMPKRNLSRGKPSHSTKKLSPKQREDAVKLTKLALAALQKGDGDSGRKKLEQALAV